MSFLSTIFDAPISWLEIPLVVATIISYSNKYLVRDRYGEIHLTLLAGVIFINIFLSLLVPEIYALYLTLIVFLSAVSLLHLVKKIHLDYVTLSYIGCGIIFSAMRSLSFDGALLRSSFAVILAAIAYFHFMRRKQKRSYSMPT